MAWSLGLLGAAGAGGAGAYDLLETTVLTSSASSVSFTGLDAYTDYKHLQIRHSLRSTNTSSQMNVRFNNDSTSSYSSYYLRAQQSTVSSNTYLNLSEIRLLNTVTYSGALSGNYSAGVMDILDFSSETKNTTFKLLNANLDIDGAGLSWVQVYSGLYNNTDALTEMTIFKPSGDFAIGSEIQLFGIRG